MLEHETQTKKDTLQSHVGVPNLEDRGAQNIHSLDGTKNHPFVTAGHVAMLTRW